MANIKLARFRVQGTVSAPQVQSAIPGCSLFPNPTAGDLIFEWSHPTAKGINIHITDHFGRTLRSLDVPDSTTRSTADVNAFAPGIYFANIRSGGTLLKTIRFVKPISQMTKQLHAEPFRMAAIQWRPRFSKRAVRGRRFFPGNIFKKMCPERVRFSGSCDVQ